MSALTPELPSSDSGLPQPSTPARPAAGAQTVAAAASSGTASTGAGTPVSAVGDAYWSPADDQILLGGLEDGSRSKKQSGAGWK
ncbi:hypothetical protein OC842_007924, partial [Tilletia horrida]